MSTNEPTDMQGCIDACNDLLKGEFSAVETYDQALEKFSGDPAAHALGEIRAKHIDHVHRLREHIVSMGGKPAEGSGAWGTFAKAVEGTAKVFGETAALHALLAGEELGIGQYEAALENENVMAEHKHVIRTHMIPCLQGNAATLRALKKD